jgi:hypothetical protein
LNVNVIVLGAVGILLLDTVGSLASKRYGFAYSKLMAGSFAIYLAVGVAANTDDSIVPSMVAGALVALIESTLGWAISWKIGPGRPGMNAVSASTILGTVAFVTGLGVVFGAIGGWLRAATLYGAG